MGDINIDFEIYKPCLNLVEIQLPAQPYELGIMCATCKYYLDVCLGGSLGEKGVCPAYAEVEKQ